jgi:hypothetical protein
MEEPFSCNISSATQAAYDRFSESADHYWGLLLTP